MNVYADTNFFTALFCSGPNEGEALRLDAVAEAQDAPGYPVTTLCRLEFVNALQQSVYSTRHGTPGIQITREHAMAVEAMFFDQLAAGDTLREARLSESLLERQFHDLSHRHTAREGFRTYDILHVASALVLGCDTFWSFDAKAKKLARLEGLAVN